LRVWHSPFLCLNVPWAAFTDPLSAFADFCVKRPCSAPYHRNRGTLMRGYYPGMLMIPILLLLLGTLSLMSSFGIIQVARVWSFWPVTLIATGLEELYLWATAKTRQ
jgi:hypothetical protein